MDADDLAAELRAVHAGEAVRRVVDDDPADEWIACPVCTWPIDTDEFRAHLEREHE